MPLPSIHTERLVLRPWTDDDIDALHGLWMDPDVRRYLWDDIAITRERATEAVRAHFESIATRGIGYWALHPADEEPLMGFCGFRGIEKTLDIEIVYGLLPSYWGRGLATEAARATLNYLWETAHARVYARTDAPNEKSIAVLHRLGFRQVDSPGPMLTYLLERPHDWKKT
jgi:ribosomal-protein-alanine N-acetyltransferase